MKKKYAILLSAALFLGASSVQAQSLSDILSKIGAGKQTNDSSSNSGSNSGIGGTLGNLIGGVLSTSNLSEKDLQGKWESQGPAVGFKSDNLLKKAGGVAAAAAIESKLEPYYSQFGLNGATLEVDQNNNFVLAIKGIKLKGTIARKEGSDNGVFEFKFQAFGKVGLGSVTTYVSKSINSLDVMFDATFLIKIVSVVGKVSGQSSIQALTSLLTSYDGLNVGFKMVSQK
ncbi:MAG: DUF4923 family protein [Bacteroidales bacterium]|nr:DUF4923 family protein [Bacteroidales bacterium]